MNIECVFDLSRRAAVVTGGTGELGRAVVRRYLDAGAHVAVATRDAAKGEELRAWLGPPAGAADDPRLLVVAADPADREAMDRLVEAVLRAWGRLDILANIAGGFDASAAASGDVAAYGAAWDKNVRTAVVATAACLRPMRASGYGRIVSMGSFSAQRGTKDAAGYAMAKTAIVRWTESLAAELRGEGITANVVMPSVIDTPSNRAQMPKADPAKWARADEVAAVILFLSSDEASGVTGAAIPVTARM